MTKPPLTLNEALHEYAAGGKPIPGVTNVIAEAGLSDFSHINAEVLEFASLRGSYVHQTTALYDRSDLNESTLDPVLQSYLAGWKSFLFDTGFKVQLIEQSDYDEILWYAGTVDRTGTIGRKVVIVEIKAAQKSKSWRYQTAAYSAIWFPGRVPLRLAVILKADGKYAVEEHKPQDFGYHLSVFRSALTLYQAKRDEK